MKNEYTAPEIIEIGNAEEVILGSEKPSPGTDDGQPLTSGNELDD